MRTLGLLTRCFGACLLLLSFARAQEVPVHQFVDQEGKTWQLKTEQSLQRFADTTCFFDPSCIILGYTRRPERTVYVLWLTPAGMEDQRVTVLHELQHVVLGDRHVLESRPEHEQIHRLSKPLLQLLHDKRNADLVRWLFLEGQ